MPDRVQQEVRIIATVEEPLRKPMIVWCRIGKGGITVVKDVRVVCHSFIIDI